MKILDLAYHLLIIIIMIKILFVFVLLKNYYTMSLLYFFQSCQIQIYLAIKSDFLLKKKKINFNN